VFGIDSIKLRVTDYNLGKCPGLQLQVAPLDIQTGERKDVVLYERDGLKLEGQKAYKNTDLYNLDLSESGLFVKFSIPKVINGHNDLPVNLDLTRKALQTVQEDLQKNDIRVNLESASLSRLDLFRQEFMSNTFLDYVPVFGLLRGQRMNKRDYGTSFLFYNSAREVCFYDKDQERAIKEGKKLSGSSNNVRSEVRFLAHRPITKTGLDIASDILNNYEGLKLIYQEEVKRVIKEPGQVGRSMLVQSDLISEMEQIKKVSGKFGLREVKEHIHFFGVSSLLEKVSFENYIQTVLQVSDHKNKRDLLRQVSDFMQGCFLNFKSGLDTDVKNLYEELYLKFVA
jgi:hypothetical protein